MPRIPRNIVSVGVLLAVAILVVDAAWIASSSSTIFQGHAQAERCRTIHSDLDRAVGLLKDAEAGQRGYLLTQRDEYLEPYYTAVTGIDPLMKSLRSVGSGERFTARVDDLERVASEKLADLDQTIRLQQQARRSEALRIVLDGRGKALMDRIRSIADEIGEEENRLMDSRLAASRSAVGYSIAGFGLTTATALLVLAAAAYLHRREAETRERLASSVRSSEAWLSATLKSIGDAVLAADHQGRIRFLNPVAQSLTGWSQVEARGRSMGEVFRIVDESTRLPVENPVARVLREGSLVGPADQSLLIRRDKTETPIDHGASPIRDEEGAISGVVLAFRDTAGRKGQDVLFREQRRLAEFGRDMGLALTESADLPTMARRCVEETVRHLDGAFARIWAVDESGETLELLASAGLYTHIDGPHARVPVGMYKIGTIARDRKPHLTNRVIGDPRVPAQDWAEREGMVAFAGYPLIVEDRMVGVWAMFARHELSEATLLSMDSVARGIAVGIERAHAEGRLRREREWLQVTLASIGDAVIATDHDGRIRFLNPIAESLTGWPVDEARGRPMAEVFRIVRERDREPAPDPVEEVLRRGTIVGLANQTVLIARGGAETPIEDSAAPIRDVDGRILGVVMVFRDVTRDRAGRAAVREAGDRLRFTLDATEVGQWDLDLSTGLATRSARHDQIFGYETPPPEWNLAIFLGQHVHPDDRAEVERSFRQSESTGEDCEFECRIIRVDGAERWIWSKAAVYSAEAGKPSRMLGLVVDVTDRKRSADDLKFAKEEAEHANQAKTQFLAVLSHELRTPLNPILLAVTSMLERPSAPEDVRANLEMIRQNVHLQSRLIDDLLDVMRIVRGKMPLHWEVVDAHVLIHHSIGICRSEVYGKGLKLTLDLAADRHHINADPVRLQQVFWNLIKNAVKFTPGGGSIAIRTRNEPDEGAREGRLVVEVADTGIGIEPEFVGRIFDPFQQGETSITRRFGGLGLGLAISKGIVEGHGGELRAESPGKGRGTTFHFALRALPDPKLEADGRPTPRQAPADHPSDATLKILLVEDEQATSRLMARLLRGLGHEVTTAATITEAAEKERLGHFTLVVSDIGLPDGSGLELIRRIIDRRGHVPAIALTGYGMEEDIQRSREAGFTAHMTKPIDFTKLEAMIRQVAP